MLPVATGPVNAVGAAPAHSQPPPRHGGEDRPGEERDLHDHQPEDRRGKIAHSEIPRLAFGVVAQPGFDRDAVHLDAAGLPGGPPVLARDGGVELALQGADARAPVRVQLTYIEPAKCRWPCRRPRPSPVPILS